MSFEIPVADPAAVLIASPLRFNQCHRDRIVLECATLAIYLRRRSHDNRRVRGLDAALLHPRSVIERTTRIFSGGRGLVCGIEKGAKHSANSLSNPHCPDPETLFSIPS
jgi:hypothetical protein